MPSPNKIKRVEKGWYARICVNPKKPCGLVEVVPVKLKVNSDEVCVPCEIHFALPLKWYSAKQVFGKHSKSKDFQEGYKKEVERIKKGKK